jgi:DNA-binding transcriptional regulator YdaS (Cro superfamily)
MAEIVANLWAPRKTVLLGCLKHFKFVNVVSMNTKPRKNEALERAIKMAGSQAALADLLPGKVRQQHVSAWLKSGVVPPKHAAEIEKTLEGRVSRLQLVWPDDYPLTAGKPREPAATVSPIQAAR